MKTTVFLWFVMTLSAFSQSAYAFANFAGQPGGIGNADGTGIAARFNYPSWVAADSLGNVYVADTENHTIRRITLAGVVITIAGSPGQSGSADGTNGAARFYAPTGIAVDGAGNLYVADYGNSTIRKITPTATNWVVTTLAGTALQTGSENGTGNAATFSDPFGVAVDGTGNVYVADTGNHIIRKITSAGVVTTLAGSAGVPGFTNAAGTTATFNYPSGVAVDRLGDVYVADMGNKAIRKVTPAGIVTTTSTGYVSPSGVAVDSAGNTYVADAGANQIGKNGANVYAGEFNQPAGVALDIAGNVYIADTYNQMIEKITPYSITVVLAGSTARPGANNGAANWASFYNPGGLAVDTSSNVYVADTDNQLIRKITPDGRVTTLAGSYTFGMSLNGAGLSINPSGVTIDNSGNVYVADDNNGLLLRVTPQGSAMIFATGFNNPQGVASDGGGNLYVIDQQNGDVKKISPQGNVASIYGSDNGMNGVTVDNVGNIYVTDGDYNRIVKINPNGIASLLAGGFNSPKGVAVDNAGNVYVADVNNDRICEISPAGLVTTIAGNPGQSGSVDGTNSTARFNNPSGVAIDGSTNLYVADQGNQTIRKITPVGTNWVVTTIAGNAGITGSIDGTNASARFNEPNYIATDVMGNLYITDQGNQRVRRITAVGTNWIVTTMPGYTGQSGSFNGNAAVASFNSPTGVAVDTLGNVYVADEENSLIREISPAGTVTSLAGSPEQIGSADGPGSNARFYYPSAVAVDGAYNVYVADTFNHTIRKISAGVVSTLAGSAGYNGNVDGTGSAARFWAPNGVAVDSAANVYVADTFNDTIRMVTPTGVVTTLAGSAGQAGSVDGTGNSARFNQPNGIVVDKTGNIYVADTYNQTIRRITPTLISGSCQRQLFFVINDN